MRKYLKAYRRQNRVYSWNTSTRKDNKITRNICKFALSCSSASPTLVSTGDKTANWLPPLGVVEMNFKAEKAGRKLREMFWMWESWQRAKIPNLKTLHPNNWMTAKLCTHKKTAGNWVKTNEQKTKTRRDRKDISWN